MTEPTAAELNRRDVLRHGGVAAGALMIGGAAMAGRSAAQEKRAIAYIRETNETDVTEGTVYNLRLKRENREVRCQQPSGADGHDVTKFRAGIEGERGSARLFVHADALELSSGDSVKLTQIIGECRQTEKEGLAKTQIIRA